MFGEGGLGVGDGIDLFVPSVSLGSDSSSFLFEEEFAALVGVEFGGV